MYIGLNVFRDRLCTEGTRLGRQRSLEEHQRGLEGMGTVLRRLQRTADDYQGSTMSNSKYHFVHRRSPVLLGACYGSPCRRPSKSPRGLVIYIYIYIYVYMVIYIRLYIIYIYTYIHIYILMNLFIYSIILK
jgi:hypothetical protein